MTRAGRTNPGVVREDHRLHPVPPDLRRHVADGRLAGGLGEVEAVGDLGGSAVVLGRTAGHPAPA
ncbi:hypothetical protein [Actinomadura rudentiformis]|uniref:hypothetical protein n=1 Tax=Actinomadura rudentiformis TaxID=359158 RepID=UPI00178C745E|nr:hypothetical protein [Actinomadura rudentiformis]